MYEKGNEYGCNAESMRAKAIGNMGTFLIIYGAIGCVGNDVRGHLDSRSAWLQSP